MTPKFSIVNVWTSRTAMLDRSCGLKSSFPGGYAFMTFNVVGNSLLNASRYWRFKADGDIRFWLALDARFAGFLAVSRPCRMTGFLFRPAAFRGARRFDFFFMLALFSSRLAAGGEVYRTGPLDTISTEERHRHEEHGSARRFLHRQVGGVREADPEAPAEVGARGL